MNGRYSTARIEHPKHDAFDYLTGSLDRASCYLGDEAMPRAILRTRPAVRRSPARWVAPLSLMGLCVALAATLSSSF